MSTTLFPLYSYSTTALAHGSAGRKPNLDCKFIEAFGSAIRLDFTPDGAGDLTTTFGPEDVFHYIYAVLHSLEYRRRYADFLKSDFPRVPLTSGNRAVFSALILGIGHAPRKPAPDGRPRAGAQGRRSRYAPAATRWTRCVMHPQPAVCRGAYGSTTKQYFESVEPEIWAFTIGGYRPAEKWLKDRKGRTLSEDDIDHYRKIVTALAETRCLMVEIDEMIEAHGGWTGAFWRRRKVHGQES